MNPFKKKIRCKLCRKNYRQKKEKNTLKYICSGYHNKSGCTNRIVIYKSFLTELINKRYDRILSDEELSQIVDYIEIENKELLEIHFTDGNEPILLKETFLQF